MKSIYLILLSSFLLLTGCATYDYGYSGYSCSSCNYGYSSCSACHVNQYCSCPDPGAHSNPCLHYCRYCNSYGNVGDNAFQSLPEDDDP